MVCSNWPCDGPVRTVALEEISVATLNAFPTMERDGGLQVKGAASVIVDDAFLLTNTDSSFLSLPVEACRSTEGIPSSYCYVKWVWVQASNWSPFNATRMYYGQMTTIVADSLLVVYIGGMK